MVQDLHQAEVVPAVGLPEGDLEEQQVPADVEVITEVVVTRVDMQEALLTTMLVMAGVIMEVKVAAVVVVVVESHTLLPMGE